MRKKGDFGIKKTEKKEFPAVPVLGEPPDSSMRMGGEVRVGTDRTPELDRDARGGRKKICGIYYLVDFTDSGVAVLYVGKSVDIARRVSTHRSLGDIAFCAVFVDECKKEELWEKEAEAIREFEPILNAHIGGGN